jgi:uncharacterized protein
MRKRFIAGASCPQCHAHDTLALVREGEQEKVACVRCHFEMQSKEQAAVEKIPPVNQVIGIFSPE